MDPETPIPLILEQLQGNTAWQMIEQRIEKKLRLLNDILIDMKPEADAREYQRVIGQMEGLRFIIKQPQMLKVEWDRARKANPTTRA